MQPATQEDIALFALMGQTLLNIQVLEECLSASITIKLDIGFPSKASREEADALLKKRRNTTLGKAIKTALNEDLYNDNLQKALSSFLKERNWLVHKSIDHIYASTDRYELFQHIKYIALEAHRIQRAIEDDLIAFSESNGMDMSHVQEAVKT